MAMELVEDAKGDPRNAQFLALASDLAYLGEDEGREGFRSQLGLDARLIGRGNTQVYIGSNDDHIVAAFRGTESPTSIKGLKDWLLTDAANLLIVPEGRLGTDLAAAGVGARFHQGFVNALADVWEPFFDAVSAEVKKKERPVWLTGHSLGGALALLAAWVLRRKFVNVHQIYTYGGPMVGNADVVKALDREYPDKIFRYVSGLDPVPKLPTVSLLANDYGHCLKEMEIGVTEAAQSAVAFFKSMAEKTADGVLHATLIDDVWKGMNERISAHFMDNYKSLIAKLTS